MSGLSEELSQYTVSFNTTLLLIQDIAIRAVTQDEIMNELRTEANAQADICIQKVNTVCCVTNTMYMYSWLLLIGTNASQYNV